VSGKKGVRNLLKKRGRFTFERGIVILGENKEKKGSGAFLTETGSGTFLPNKACVWLSQTQEGENGENGVSHLFKNKKSNSSTGSGQVLR